YMLVIAAMCAAAIGVSGAGAPWMIPVGALMFTVSDIAVVRDRFVSPGFINRFWGLPLYYAAQLIIAWSILAVQAMG
ncbi:MAG: lysoplasmalogenase family protein, partial [Polyangiales bacterium]